MNDLWELIEALLRQPLILLLLGASILSGLGQMLGKAAQRAQREARRRGGEAGGRPVAPPARPAAGARPARRPAQRQPADLAEEIRRMMGLEDQPVRVPAERPPPPAAAEPAAGDRGALHPGHLDEELVERASARRPASRFGARSAQLDEGVSARGAVGSVRPREALRAVPGAAPGAAPVRRRQPPRFDRRDLAGAIIAMEVLGPPRALRPHDEDLRRRSADW